jgi:hypothetical protein
LPHVHLPFREGKTRISGNTRFFVSIDIETVISSYSSVQQITKGVRNSGIERTA